VYDRVNLAWVSRVALGVGGKSFNFDPVFEACNQFRPFIVPWMLRQYEPGIHIQTKLPILSVRFVISNREG
jgi:hypothetical protein